MEVIQWLGQLHTARLRVDFSGLGRAQEARRLQAWDVDGLGASGFWGWQFWERLRQKANLEAQTSQKPSKAPNLLRVEL